MKVALLGLVVLSFSRAALADPPERRVRLSAAETSAFGLTRVSFFNQLAGARADYRFSDRFAFGGAFSYANLKGKDGRVSNVLPELALEYRLPLGESAFGIPWRFAGGVLPKNGPTLRFTVGLDVNLSDTIALELDPIEPMIWVTKNRPEVSANVSALLKISL
jgi:hypothetical protein